MRSPIARRVERHLAEARLPVGKTLQNFEFEAVPMVSKAQIMALTAGDKGVSICGGEGHRLSG